MVRTIRPLFVPLLIGIAAATENHVPFEFPNRAELSKTPAIAYSTTPSTTITSAPNIAGGHKAYLQFELASLDPTTLLTITTTTSPAATTASSTSSKDVRRRQLGGLLGGLGSLGGLGGLAGGGGALGGVVSNVLGGLQPAVTAALGPIQSAANTNLAQLSLVKSLAPQVIPTANVIGPAATAANPVLGNLLGGILSAVAPIISNVGGLASQVAGPVESLAGPLESAVAGPVTAAVGPLVSALAPAVAAALSPVQDAAGGLIQPVATNLLGPIESAVAPLLAGAVSAAMGALGGVENPVADALRPVLDGVDDAILPIASAAVSAIWPAIAPIVTPLNPVICALQPAEVPIGGNATALIPVQCVSVTSGNMVPVSTGVATVTSPQGLLSITPATLAPPLSTNGVPDRAVLPVPGIPGLPVPTPTTTITAPLPPATLSPNPLASFLSAVAASTSSLVFPTPQTNPLGSAAAAASSFLAGLGTTSNAFGISLPLPTLPSSGSTANTLSPANAGLSNTGSSGLPAITDFTDAGGVTGGGNVFTVAGVVSGVLTALPAVAPSSVQMGNMGMTPPSLAKASSSPLLQSTPAEPCMMMATSLITVPVSNLPNAPLRIPDAPPPASPLPVTDPTVSDNLPPVGGIFATTSPTVTPPPVIPPGGLIMLAYGTQTITFAASQLAGGGLVASIGGSAYAFPPASSALPGARRRRDTPDQPDYEALALALVSLLTKGGAHNPGRNASSSSPINTEQTPLADLAMATSIASTASNYDSVTSARYSDDADAISFREQLATQTSSSEVESPSTTLPETTVSSTTDAATSGASLDIPSCPDINGTSYLSNGGSVYQIICGINWVGRDVQPWRRSADFESCVAECDSLNAAARNRPCAAALFVPDAPLSAANCYPKYSVDNPTNVTGGYTFQAAVLKSSGRVVDNGIGIPVSHIELPVVKIQSDSFGTNDTVLEASSVAPSTGDATNTADAPSNLNTLDLTSLTTLGGLNVSKDASSEDPFGASPSGVLVMYATGTKVVEPVLSTTVMLGAASNQPATQYFVVSSSATASALARRDILPSNVPFDPPTTGATAHTLETAGDGGSFVNALAPEQASSRLTSSSTAAIVDLNETGTSVADKAFRFFQQLQILSGLKKSPVEVQGPEKSLSSQEPYKSRPAFSKQGQSLNRVPSKRPPTTFLVGRGQFPHVMPTSEASSSSRHEIAAASSTGITKRQDGEDSPDPNAYNPVSNTTGPNFALANNPVDPATGTLASSEGTENTFFDMASSPSFSRDGGKGGMVGGQHVFAFADTGVYTSSDDGSNGHYVGYASSSVATDLGQHGLFGNGLILQDGVGEFADALGNLRGFIPLTVGETSWNDQAVAAGVSSRYAIWPESSFIPLTTNSSIMYAPMVYDVVDKVSKSADFTYLGNTLVSIMVDDVAGPVAERLARRLFNASDVEWGCVGGIRSWGESGIGGEDGLVYLFGNVRGGLLMARVNASDVSDLDAYQYWEGKSWTSGSLAPDSTAYILEGSFMDVDIFYSPRHLTFIAVYTNIKGDNTIYWRYLDAPQAILPGYAGGDSSSDMVEAITKFQWSDEHTLFKMGAGLNGDYSYAAGVHLGYFGQNDIANGGEKMLLSWTSPTGQDPASRNSAFQLMSGVVSWT